MIPVGTKQEYTFTVEEAHTALQIQSGNARVLATPHLAAMLEKAAHELCIPYLDEGCATVGTHLSLNHLAATPVGMKVTVSATVTNTEGRKIEFSLEAYDEAEKIADGTHTRFSVLKEKFQAKCDAKKKLD
ncbi:MAG: thioesterase family protein [Clostridia bacterium]|nr:thioesterase family protein [Clostridia bacterium]